MKSYKSAAAVVLAVLATLVFAAFGCSSTTLPVQEAVPEATALILLDFESVPMGLLATNYEISGSEVLPASTEVLVKRFGRGPDAKLTDGPEIVSTVDLAAQGTQSVPVGAQALAIDSGRRTEGLVVDLPEAVEGTQPYGPSSVTIEFVFMTRALNPKGNAFGFQYLGGNEWPNGQWFSWSFRTAVDQTLNFVAFQGTKEARLHVKEQIVPGVWYHAAGVLAYNAADPAQSNLQFYINGILQNEQVYDASKDVFSLGGSNTVHGNGFSIGYSYGQDANGGDNRGLDGAIDAVAVTMEALGPDRFILL